MLEAIQKNLKRLLVAALRLEARGVIARYRPRIVAVTGSVGKTSTKDAIFSVLAADNHVRKSQKSFNSEIGLPLTVLGRPNPWKNPLRWAQNLLDGLFLLVFRAPYPQWLVLEVGADRPGDISQVARWLPVDVAVITRLPEVPVHVEFFSSADEVVKEKAALIGALKNLPAGREGTVVLYGDDARVEEFKVLAGDARVITFGLSEAAQVRAHGAEPFFDAGARWPAGMRAAVTFGGESASLEVCGAVGAHTLLPGLAALAVGAALGKPLSGAAAALHAYVPPPGRMHLIEGARGSLIIDDTYNSSPAAVEAGLETLRGINAGRRIAVLGDMLELGRHSVEEHRKAGVLAASCADMLVTVGFRARDTAQGALEAGMSSDAVLQFEDARAAGERLSGLLQEGDCVFVKGSQGIRLERAVEKIMAHPERAKELLVRQEREWKKR